MPLQPAELRVERQRHQPPDHALSVCAAAGVAPRIVQEANELFTVLSLVGAGLGVSLVPRSAALMHLPGVQFRALTLPEAAWDIGVAWHRDAAHAPLVAQFAELVGTGRPRSSRRRAAPGSRGRSTPARGER
jgi:DNA-binding transcriptional LysR family regulator